MNPQSSSSSPPLTDSTDTQSLIERFSAKHTSKIPVPVLARNKSRNRSSSTGSQQRTLKAQIRDSVSHYSGSSLNNSKVDQIIADLLIEALNHSTDIGIEFIKTPQNPPSQSQSHLKLSHSKRTSVNSRRSNGIVASGSGPSGSGKRSSHGSAKYQQVFDSIPEEKSGSLSYESPSDEKSSLVERASTNSNGNATSETESKATNKSTPSPTTNETSRKSSPNARNNGVSTKVSSGKAAIESDQDKSETWFGCFGRTHVDSPVDGLLMEEGILKIIHNTSLAV